MTVRCNTSLLSNVKYSLQKPIIVQNSSFAIVWIPLIIITKLWKTQYNRYKTILLPSELKNNEHLNCYLQFITKPPCGHGKTSVLPRKFSVQKTTCFCQKLIIPWNVTVQRWISSYFYNGHSIKEMNDVFKLKHP